MTKTLAPSPTGRALYHAIWQLVAETFFDTKRLADWSSWEHRFDDQIDTEEAALRVADQMLASLGDTYTERVVPQAVTSVEASAPDVQPEKPQDVLAVLTPSNVGYLRISSFDNPDVFELIEAGVAKIAACDGVILDLRGNSGGRIHEALAACGFFIDNGLLTTLKFRHGDGIKLRQYFVNETQFFAVEELPDGTKATDMYPRCQSVLAGKPIIVLINSRTASGAEMMLCAIVQNGTAGKVLIVGTGPTPGKGIGQAEYCVPDSNVKVRVTRCHWFAPGGQWLGDCGQTEHNGVGPDVEVPGDRGAEGLKVASDELKKMLGRSEAA